MNVACSKGDYEYQAKQELEDMIRECALNPYDDIWISETDGEYPCLAILVNGNYACVHYFLDDCGTMWQSIGNYAQDIYFQANGEVPSPMPGDCVISLNKAIECMRLFFETQQRPDCIEWREL